MLWYLQHSLHRIFWPLLLSISGSSAASRVLPAPAVLPTATSSTADGLTFLAIDAKGGEGALECLDLGEAHGLLMEIIRFWLPLATHDYLCWTIATHVYLYLAWTLFETCVWIWTLVCNVWWTMLVCATLIYLCSSCGCEVVLTMLKFISYISCILYASISTCRENSVKSFKFIYVCTWYSWKFICTYQGGVLSTHRTWWIYS